MALRVVLAIVLFGILLVVVVPLALYLGGADIFNFGSSPAGGQMSGALLRSEDEGQTWVSSAVSENPSVPFPSIIYKFVFHPTDPHTVFIGSKGSGLWKSINDGHTWVRVADSARILNASADVYDIEISALHPAIMYAAVFQEKRGRVLRSEDGGVSFREVYMTTRDGTGVFSIAIDPGNDNHVFIATGQNGLLESHNAGVTWRVRKWFTEAPTRIIVNPSLPSEMYVVLASGNILKTNDSGNNWGNLSVNPGNKNVSGGGGDITVETFPSIGSFFPFGSSSGGSSKTLVFDPNKFSTLYVGSEEGLLRSRDGGLTWARLNLLIPPEVFPITAVAIDPRTPLIIYAGAQRQLHRSSDDGINWSVRDLPARSKISGFFINPFKPNIIFAVVK